MQIYTNNDKYYQTASFNLASFLVVKGIELLDIKKDQDSSRHVFIFVQSPRTEQLVHNFNFAKENDPEVLVDARNLMMKTKSLKEKLYQERYGK